VRLLCYLLLALTLLATPVLAQSCVVNGTPIVGSYQHLAPTVATGLTAVPGAHLAVISVSTATVYYRDDGTAPTTSAGGGVPLPVGVYCYASRLDLIKFISATGLVDVAFYGG
jgi:hypothetical protein